MKLKFRAESDDIKKYLIFCGILLYVVALIVINSVYFQRSGELYGILPFEAFSLEFLPSTLIIYFIVLIAITASAGSYFFDREKGIGIVKGKTIKDGYARWAKSKEMQEGLTQIDPMAETIAKGGIMLIDNAKDGIWIDAGEDHNVVIGSTGSGKTVLVAKPMIQILAKAGESMILTDPKGELYESSGEMLREKGYNVIVLNFRDPNLGSAWNPMTLPYRYYKDGNIDKAIELTDDLGLNILYDEKSGNNDPFWEKSSADYFSGLTLSLFEDATEDQINLNSINLMVSLGDERCGGPNNTYMKEYFNMKDPSRPAYVSASGVVYAPEETKGGVLATFKQKVRLFSSRDNLSEMLSYSSFDMRDIGRQKTAVFLIIQDEKKTLHPLATIFIKQCYETLIDVAQENGGKLKYRTNFILDEFANMPPLKDVTTMVTAARSRLIKFVFIIQNYAQLTQVYGKENAETIKGNCSTVYLLSSELTALEEISKRCGEVKSKDKEKTANRPLITVSDLQRLPEWTVIVLKNRMYPYKTKFVPGFKINWGKEYPKSILEPRTPREVSLFDIREFVKEKQKEKIGSGGINPNMGSMPGDFGGMGNPFGGAFPVMGGFSPFGSSNSNMLKRPAMNQSSNFDVDELVKKIDAKIAALEEEERLEKENQQKIVTVIPNNSSVSTSDDAFFDDFFDDN